MNNINYSANGYYKKKKIIENMVNTIAEKMFKYNTDNYEITDIKNAEVAGDMSINILELVENAKNKKKGLGGRGVCNFYE